MLGWPLQKNKNLIHRKRSRWVFASLNGERYQRGFGSNSGEENGIRRRGFGHNRPLIQHVWPLLIGVSYETFRETVVRLRALLHVVDLFWRLGVIDEVPFAGIVSGNSQNRSGRVKLASQGFPFFGKRSVLQSVHRRAMDCILLSKEDKYR